jgi:hypothetical protein
MNALQVRTFAMAAMLTGGKDDDGEVSVHSFTELIRSRPSLDSINSRSCVPKCKVRTGGKRTASEIARALLYVIHV